MRKMTRKKNEKIKQIWGVGGTGRNAQRNNKRKVPELKEMSLSIETYKLSRKRITSDFLLTV